jgi:hypothetical protein
MTPMRREYRRSGMPSLYIIVLVLTVGIIVGWFIVAITGLVAGGAPPLPETPTATPSS